MPLLLFFHKFRRLSAWMGLAFVVLCPTTTGWSQTADQNLSATSDTPASEASVELTKDQLQAIKIESAALHPFALIKEEIGSIAFNGGAVTSGSKGFIGNALESDAPLLRVDQSVVAHLTAYPGRSFVGKITALGGSAWDGAGNPAVDPNTHRVTFRCEIEDPNNELFPGMLAAVAIQVQEAVSSVGLPENSVVRNGDGTFAVWVTSDQHKFFQRFVKIGLKNDGQDQILDGIKPGDLVVTDGAIFLSNILYAPPSD